MTQLIHHIRASRLAGLALLFSAVSSGAVAQASSSSSQAVGARINQPAKPALDLSHIQWNQSTVGDTATGERRDDSTRNRAALVPVAPPPPPPIRPEPSFATATLSQPYASTPLPIFTLVPVSGGFEVRTTNYSLGGLALCGTLTATNRTVICNPGVRALYDDLLTETSGSYTHVIADGSFKYVAGTAGPYVMPRICGGCGIMGSWIAGQVDLNADGSIYATHVLYRQSNPGNWTWWYWSAKWSISAAELSAATGSSTVFLAQQHVYIGQ